MPTTQDFYVIYTRVSTKDQGDSGLGLEGQLQAIDHYIKSKGGIIVGSFSDIASGTQNPLKRKGFRNALVTANNLDAILVVSHLDRLSRNFAALTILTQREYPLSYKRFGTFDVPRVIACCEAQDELTTRIRAVMAEEEVKAIRRRIKAALDIRKQRGDWQPGADALAAAKERYFSSLHLLPRIRAFRRHNRSWQSIADQLNNEGILSHLNKPWTRFSIINWYKKASEFSKLLQHISSLGTT